MNYGFLINNDTCIGCHACSTACKSENEVPLGVNRTWVKTVETGVFPDVTRNFQVTRCNHCSNPPCVRICPVTAMYQRDDGIVEFDPDSCIGCKACMQACPYDAIYIDPESGTAAKCHYCAHRVDIGLEPACVVVCPEHSILAGDLDDPLTEISQMIARNKVTVRRPEQGTVPNLYYIGGDDMAMHPTAVQGAQETFAWSDPMPEAGTGGVREKDHRPNSSPRKTSPSGQPLRTPQPQGIATGGPIQIGKGRMAEQMTQVVWNAQHRVPWHWPVPAYLVTKGIAAGMFLIVSLMSILRIGEIGNFSGLITASCCLFFLVVTTALLVYDLERPERFLRIVTRPQWKSWLVRGAYLLIAFSILVTIWAAGELALWMSWIAEADYILWRTVLNWVGVPLAVGTAVYTAFLFGQAEGRDLWQSSLLPLHLIVQSFVAGAAFFMIVGSVVELDADVIALVRLTFITSLVLDLLVTMFGEFGMPHASEAAARAAHMIVRGRYARSFWIGSVLFGHLIPLGLDFVNLPGAVAGILALVGLFLYERAFVSAPQEIPNS